MSHIFQMVLYWIHELKQEEIADLLSIPIGTVKGRSSRARVELARRILALPHVAAGSHSATHPADWRAPGVDLAREIDGSVDEIEDRKAATIGITANYQNAWSGDLSYTRYFGAGRHNLINDRDFLAANVKYSF